MRNRSSKRAQDVNEAAFAVVRAVTEESQSEVESDLKNPAAVELGRLGGLKGGRSRALKLSAEKRKEIAQKAADARWKKP